MTIDAYSFGKISVHDRVYMSDVIVYPDRVDSSWWRKEGHRLQPEDLAEIIASRPDTVIIGTGYYGAMQVPEDTRRFLESMGIRVIVEQTGEAIKLFNEQQGEKTVGAFHLTC